MTWHAASARHAASVDQSNAESQSPKAKTEAVEDLGAQRKKFPPNLNSSQKYLSTTKPSLENRNQNLSQKCVSKQETLVKIVTFTIDTTVDCKCVNHNSILKNFQENLAYQQA